MTYVVVDRETDLIVVRIEGPGAGPDQAKVELDEWIKTFILNLYRKRLLSKFETELMEEYAKRRFKVYSLEKFPLPTE